MTPKVQQLPTPVVNLPDAPASPPVFQSQAAGQKPGRKTPTRSFIGGADLPTSGGLANKTLVGQ